MAAGGNTTWKIGPENHLFQKICLALSRNDVVRYNRRSELWLRTLDPALYNKSTVPGMMLGKIKQDGFIKTRYGATGDEHSMLYSVLLTIEGVEYFIKFALDPDDPENPGIEVCSPHD